MVYPPTLPPNSRSDATPAAGNHAEDHNKIANALTAVIAALPANPSGLPAYAGERANRYTGNIYNLKPSNVRKLRAGLSRARYGTGLCNIGIIGDSASEGQVGGGTFDRVKAWPHTMRTTWKEMGIPSAGDGLVYPSTVAPMDPRVTYPVGTWSTATGYTSSSTNGGKARWTFTEPCTHFDVFSSGVSGAFTISVDGGATLATVNPTGLSSWTKTTVSVAGPAAVHYLEVTKTNTTATAIKAVRARQASGIVVDNSAVSGWSAGDWVTFTGWFQHAGSAEAIAPKTDLDAVFIGLGANDIMLQAKTPAQAKASLDQVIARWQPGPNLILVGVQQSQAIAEATWETYLELMMDAADTNDCPFINIYDRIGSYATASAMGLYGDTSHLIAPAADDWGRHVALALAG